MGWPIKIEPWLAFLGGGVSYSPPYYQEFILFIPHNCNRRRIICPNSQEVLNVLRQTKIIFQRRKDDITENKPLLPF